MQTKDRTRDRISDPVEVERGAVKSAIDLRRHARTHVASRISALQVRRITGLAERFQGLCALRSDPMRLAELLHSLIKRSREAFTAEAPCRDGIVMTSRPTIDQTQCMDDLELLMQGLVRGAPSASRGLAHAMDALLIQCVVFQAATSPVEGDADMTDDRAA